MADARRRAIHESAHAIGCIAKGMELRSVSLAAVNTAIPLMDLEAVDAIIVSLSGAAAERKAFGGAAQLDANDVLEADGMIGGLGHGWSRRHFELVADGFVSDHWRLIQRLADRLLREESLTGDAVLQLVRETT